MAKRFALVSFPVMSDVRPLLLSGPSNDGSTDSGRLCKQSKADS